MSNDNDNAHFSPHGWRQVRRSSLVCHVRTVPVRPETMHSWIYSRSKKVGPMPPTPEPIPEAIRQIVATTWRQTIGLPQEWTEPEKQAFLEQEADRIATLIENQMDGQGPLVRQWWTEHGQAPDYPTTVALIEQARRTITETVLQNELFDQITTDPDPFPAMLSTEEAAERDHLETQVRIAQAADDPTRWTHPLRRNDPSPELVALSKQLWPDRSALFRVTGSFLLQVRTEDGQPIPSGPTDPLTASFTSQVHDALIAAGRPLDGPGKLVDP